MVDFLIVPGTATSNKPPKLSAPLDLLRQRSNPGNQYLLFKLMEHSTYHAYPCLSNVFSAIKYAWWAHKVQVYPFSSKLTQLFFFKHQLNDSTCLKVDGSRLTDYWREQCSFSSLKEENLKSYKLIDPLPLLIIQ